MELATVYFSSPERGRRTEYGLTAGELGGNSQGVFPTAPIQYRNQPVPVRSSIAGAPNFFLRWLQRMLRTELQGPEGEHLGFFVWVSTWNGVYQNRGEWQPVVDRSGRLPLARWRRTSIIHSIALVIRGSNPTLLIIYY